jgi:hypothetical protein
MRLCVQMARGHGDRGPMLDRGPALDPSSGRVRLPRHGKRDSCGVNKTPEYLVSVSTLSTLHHTAA